MTKAPRCEICGKFGHVGIDHVGDVMQSLGAFAALAALLRYPERVVAVVMGVRKSDADG